MRCLMKIVQRIFIGQGIIVVHFYDDNFMPHIHLEYSDNLQSFDARPVLEALNRAFFASGYVNSALDIKSRAVCQQVYVVGLEQDHKQAYMHIKVSLLTGRSIAIQKEISALLLKVLQENDAVPVGLSIQMCVEMLEMNKETYSKQIVE